MNRTQFRPHPRFLALPVMTLLAASSMTSEAHDPATHGKDTQPAVGDTITGISLKEVSVVANRRNPFIEVAKIDIDKNPVKSSQEILRTVPGLFIAQHAGGGKAEQMFLRGFDLDHGTDISLWVDGMPVNMVSHAHGQGYADLHFLQPELIENVEFEKGNYNMMYGDLANAGYVAFKTKDRMPNAVGVEIGMHDYQRYAASLSFINKRDMSFYASGAFLTDKGFFDNPQNFKRFNFLSKFTRWTDASSYSISLWHFNSSWNASGQIPERAVDNHIIGWFGSLDPSEGGSTSRSSLNFQHHVHLDDDAEVKSNLYLSYYTFDLHSNFTFYLNDPENGDEIHQKERRFIAGGNSQYSNQFFVGSEKWKWAGGVGFRYDRVNDIGLYHTRQRTELGTYALGDISESALWAYVGIEMNLGKWMINPAVRVDWFQFSYADKTATEYSDPNKAQAAVSPKLNIIYNPSDVVQIFLKGGKGFHSNDARVVVVNDGHRVLPSSYGVDLGLHWKPFKTVMLYATGWYQYLEDELVYVGDEAIVEPSGKSRRFGADAGVRWEFLKNFYFQFDYTYSHGRFINEPEGENYIPLAPVHTFLTGLTFQNGPWKAGITGRYLGRRPANEDNSLTTSPYFIVDMSGSFTWKKFTFGLAIENLFNTKWREAQFATETLIPGDSAPVTDICFTPGTPFSLRGSVAFKF